MTMEQKVAQMNTEATRIANEASLNDIQTKLDILAQKRLARSNREIEMSGTAYSGLNERITILVSARTKKLIQM